MYGNEVQPAQNEPQEFIMLNLRQKDYLRKGTTILIGPGFILMIPIGLMGKIYIILHKYN